LTAGSLSALEYRLPDADDKAASATFYFELRRDGRPVDPQSRLGSRDQKTEDTRVRE